jgi:hypothetical protein
MRREGGREEGRKEREKDRKVKWGERNVRIALVKSSSDEIDYKICFKTHFIRVNIRHRMVKVINNDRDISRVESKSVNNPLHMNSHAYGPNSTSHKNNFRPIGTRYNRG